MTATETERNPLLDLLTPFPPEHVGKLPRVICGDCSDRRKHCDKHKKSRCSTCNAWVSPSHIHLDYVGHADVTRRLLEVDPTWHWEPAATDDNGLPLLDTDDQDNPVGMWIKLTVLGVTRLGYGSCPSGQNDAVKVLIGDALRNAAMRFGVALDLWAKGDRADPAAENAVAAPGKRAAQQPAPQAWPKAPPEQVGPVLEEFKHMISVATTEDEVRALRKRSVDDLRTGRLDSTSVNEIQQIIKQRLEQLAAPADGLPRNKDGTISRSRVTDEQLAAVGAMTRPQAKEHNKLVKDTVANPKLADRSHGVDEVDEQWMTGGESS